MNKASPQLRVGSVANAAAILRHLAESGTPAGVNAIARAADISPSSCFNILKTLVREEFVQFDSTTKAYSLGPAIIGLARTADPNVFPVAKPILQRTAERFEATVALWRIIRRNKEVLLGFAESDLAIRIHMTLGQQRSSRMGAGGRAYLPTLNLTDEELEQEFNKMRWHSAPSLKEYLQDLDLVRARGWSIDDGRYIAALTTTAAAVADSAGAAQFLVTATVFHKQHPSEQLEKLGEETARRARQLSTMICD